MALFYHGLNQTELALRHTSWALLLLSLSSGPDHPDKNERLFGEEHIQTAAFYDALAIAVNCMGAFKLSHQQLFNIIHSGVNSEAANNENNGGNKKVIDHPPSIAGDAPVMNQNWYNRI
ncbi:OLC1v1001622C1 [Oldenlandia corymbosa var. corymbosa]|nr:OLC1v1001622C1 [Oldenlandia corymbosa var. corymbosa]